MSVPYLSLNDGHHIPQLGYGTYLVKPEVATERVLEALEVGYRHIDTAQMYGNEAEIGEGIRQSDVDRDAVYLTSKLNNNKHRPDDARRAFDETLQKLQTDYVDLFLIHWPLPTLYDGDFVSTWETLESFKKDGHARSIGVSNFQPGHLQELFDRTTAVPAVNQIEAHPQFCNDEVRRFGARHNILTEAWSPIAKARILDEAPIKRIAKATGKTPAQVILRWHIQRGDIIFPKTDSPERMRENFDLFDFELTGAQMTQVSAMDQGEDGRIGPHPDTFDWMPS